MTNINLYATASDSRKVNKSLTLIKNISETVFTTNNDIVNPVVEVTAFENWDNVNYLYINDLHRFYYVTSKETLTGGRIRYKCHVDVLMSNGNRIKDLKAIVKRSGAVNPYIADDKQVILSKTAKRIINPSTLYFSMGQTSSDAKNIILLTLGKGGN